MDGNMNLNMEKLLGDLGLSSNECKAYLSLLKTNELKVADIVKDTNIPQSKIYSILERLLDKKLTSYKLKGSTKYFVASSPELLFNLIDEKEERVNEEKKLLEENIPILKKLRLNENKVSVEYFEGLKGLKTAYTLFIENTSENSVLKYYYPYDDFDKSLDLFYKNFWSGFKGIAFDSKGIFQEKIKKTKRFQKIGKSPDFKFVNFPLPGLIDILDNKTLIINWSENPSAILISSKEITSNFRKYFNSIWDIGKE